MSKVFTKEENERVEKVFVVELTPTNYLGAGHEVLIRVNEEIVAAIICPRGGTGPQGVEIESRDRLTIFESAAKKIGLKIRVNKAS